jgi:hypothetical protein
MTQQRITAHTTETIKPMQLELPATSESGKVTRKYKPCGNEPTIPGLDASLCRCPVCLARASQGIWWVDLETRKSMFNPKIWAQKWGSDCAIASSIAQLDKIDRKQNFKD